MKIGGGLNGASGGGKTGEMDLTTNLVGKGKQNGPEAGNLGNVLSFGTSALNGSGGQGVQFGDSKALAQTGESGKSQSGSSENTITQLLNAILELLKGSEANKEKNGSGSGTGNGSSGTQDASGSGDIMTQLMEMIKKMLGQSSEGSNASGQNGSPSSSQSGSSQSGNGSDQTQDSSGLAAKLGGALQMLGMGAILSALSGGAGAQGGGESK